MNASMNRKGRTSNSDTMESMDPVSMLKQDHKKVKQLFDQYESTDDERVQMEVAKKAITELKVHAAIEEEIFYPAVGSMVDDTELMSEATEEHHVVHFLIDELENQDLDHDTFHAKFIVLAENVRHHIKEEEGEMMPKIDGDAAEMEELGARMTERKQALMENPDAISRKSGSRTPTRQSAGSSPKATKGSRAGTSKDGDSDGGRSSTRKPNRPGSPRATR